MESVLIRRLPWREWPSYSSAWGELLSSSRHSSFFLSPIWIQTWLGTFGVGLSPELLFFESGQRFVGCCLISRSINWSKGIPLRCLHFNCAGENEADSTCIEYNALIALPEFEEAVASALARHLRQFGWDQLILSGIAEQPALESLAVTLGKPETSRRPSYFVNLERLRREGNPFSQQLSSNTRQQIRRSKKLYEQTAPCVLHAAATLDEALLYLADLGELHQKAWQDRNRPGVFSSPRFVAFHQELIRAAFPHGQVHLLRLEAGSQTIAVLYNFCYQGRVYFYQSGFLYSKDNRLKPGLLAHNLAIEHYLDQKGVSEYDFLAGDAQYKRSLSTDSRHLLWTTVWRSTAPAVLFRALRRTKRGFARLFQGSRLENPT